MNPELQKLCDNLALALQGVRRDLDGIQYLGAIRELIEAHSLGILNLVQPQAADQPGATPRPSVQGALF